jgi:hypothetical protein
MQGTLPIRAPRDAPATDGQNETHSKPNNHGHLHPIEWGHSMRWITHMITNAYDLDPILEPLTTPSV